LCRERAIFDYTAWRRLSRAPFPAVNALYPEIDGMRMRQKPRESARNDAFLDREDGSIMACRGVGWQ
jgi:hypothetical protein